jgi:hypothetical protein
LTTMSHPRFDRLGEGGLERREIPHELNAHHQN